MAVTPGAEVDVGAASYDAVNIVESSVPGTAGYLTEVSLVLANSDCAVAGDYVIFKFFRDADDAADTASGDMGLRALTLEFTTA